MDDVQAQARFGFLSNDEAREAYPLEEIQAEQEEIQRSFQSMRFAEQTRAVSLACLKKCGGRVGYPFRVEPQGLIGKNEICFGDCMNVNFEQGPFLRELGDVPEGAIPKKFIWGHGI